MHRNHIYLLVLLFHKCNEMKPGSPKAYGQRLGRDCSLFLFLGWFGFWGVDRPATCSLEEQRRQSVNEKCSSVCSFFFNEKGQVKCVPSIHPSIHPSWAFVLFRQWLALCRTHNYVATLLDLTVFQTIPLLVTYTTCSSQLSGQQRLQAITNPPF